MFFPALIDELDKLIQTKYKTTDKGSNSHNYTEQYNRYFREIKNRPVKLVEIGVGGGDFLRACRDFFKSAQIFGIDNNPEYKRYEKEGFKLFIGDQGNIEFMRQTMQTIGMVDIIIDDGGHYMDQQINSLKTCFEWVNAGGVYIIEDLFSSFDGRFTNQELTTMKYIKHLLNLCAYQKHDARDDFEKKFRDMIYSMHFYNNIVFFFKK